MNIGSMRADSADFSSDNVLEYTHQVNSLTLIRYLNLLVITCQKYRGAGIALLGGDITFENGVHALQRQIHWSLKNIRVLNQQYGSIIQDNEWFEIESHWEALTQNWRSDTVITCFEMHSHFIEMLHKLMWSICVNAYYFSMIPKLDGAEIAPSSLKKVLSGHKDHQVLVQITMRLMPEMIETIARIRGIATHAVVCGVCDHEHKLRLSYLIQKLNAQKEQLAVVPKSLQHGTLTRLPSLAHLLLYEHKLDQLQQTLRNDVMCEGEINLVSQQLFEFATSIIDVYYNVIEDGMLYFQQNLEGMLAVDVTEDFSVQ